MVMEAKMPLRSSSPVLMAYQPPLPYPNGDVSTNHVKKEEKFPHNENCPESFLKIDVQSTMPGDAAKVTMGDGKEFCPANSKMPKRPCRKNAWGNLSYADLITQAIQSSNEKRLTLSQIYEWMVHNIPYFKDKGDSNSSAGWKNSIRHNLSLHTRFMRIPNEGTGKSSWWVLNPDTTPGKSTRRRSCTDGSKLDKRRGRFRKKCELFHNSLFPFYDEKFRVKGGHSDATHFSSAYPVGDLKYKATSNFDPSCMRQKTGNWGASPFLHSSDKYANPWTSMIGMQSGHERMSRSYAGMNYETEYGLGKFPNKTADRAAYFPDFGIPEYSTEHVHREAAVDESPQHFYQPGDQPAYPNVQQCYFVPGYCIQPPKKRDEDLPQPNYFAADAENCPTAAESQSSSFLGFENLHKPSADRGGDREKIQPSCLGDQSVICSSSPSLPKCLQRINADESLAQNIYNRLPSRTPCLFMQAEPTFSNSVPQWVSNKASY